MFRGRLSGVLVPLALCLAMAVTAKADTAKLMTMVPGDWPVIATMDISENTASGRFWKKMMEEPDNKAIEEWNRSFEIGLAKLLMNLGMDIDAEKGLMPWVGQQAVMAMDPVTALSDPSALMSGKIGSPVGIVIAISSKDKALAEASLNGVMGSIIRDSDPVTEVVQGATIHIWKNENPPMQPAFAVGEDFVLFADSADRIKQGLAAMGKPNSLKLAEAIGMHKDDAFAFAIDSEKIAPILMGAGAKADGGEGGMPNMAMASMMIPGVIHGGMNYSEEGMAMTVSTKVPPMMAMVAGQMGLGPSVSSDFAELLPARTLGFTSVSSGAMVSAATQMIPEKAMAEKVIKALGFFTEAAGKSPVGVALTGILPRPNYVFIARGDTPQEATAIVSSFRGIIAEKGMATETAKQTKPAGLIRIFEKDKPEKTMGYAGVSNATAFFASDYRTAQMVSSVTPANSLASHESYAGVRKMIGAGGAMNAWMSTQFISASGYLYESLGMADLPGYRSMVESIKSTTGMGMRMGLDGDQASLRMGIKSGLTPTPYGWTAYTVGIAGASMLGAFVGSSTMQGLDEVTTADAATLDILGAAILEYAEDNNGVLPTHISWQHVIKDYLEDGASMESELADEGVVIAYNRKLNGRKLSSVKSPESTVLLYQGVWDTATETYLPAEDEDGMVTVVYVDGYVETLHVDELGALH